MKKPRRITSLLLVTIMILLCACSCSSSDNPADTEQALSNHETDIYDNNYSNESSPNETTGNTSETVEKNMAINSGAVSKYNISDGKAYIVDVTLHDGDEDTTWSLSIPVSSEFKLDELENVGCCNSYLEPIDLQIKVELDDNILCFEPAESTAQIDGEDADIYLIIVGDYFRNVAQASYCSIKNGEVIDTINRKMQCMTGEITFSWQVNDFSEGYCWSTITYSDTNKKVYAVVDKQGNIISTNRDDTIYEYGEFHSGLSLLKHKFSYTDEINGYEFTRNGVIFEYVDIYNNVVFSSDDPEYHDLIKGMLPDGYIFLERTETSLTSNQQFYAIIDYNKNFIIDWTEYNNNDYYLFNYMGEGVFAFFRGRESPIRLYNANDKTWMQTTNDYRYSSKLDDFWKQPELILTKTEGWFVVDTYWDGDTLFVSTRDKKVFFDDSHIVRCGIPSDGKIFIFADDYRSTELYYINLEDGSTTNIEYEYWDLVETPNHISTSLRTLSYSTEWWPSNNFFYEPDWNLTPVSSSTIYYDYRFSNGVMLLSLKGVDGLKYYALMDENGNNVFEPINGNAISTLGEGRFVVEKDDTRYIINEKGETLDIFPDKNPGALYIANEFHEGLAWVSTDTARGFMDVDGNYIFGYDDVLDRIDSVNASAMIQIIDE